MFTELELGLWYCTQSPVFQRPLALSCNPSLSPYLTTASHGPSWGKQQTWMHANSTAGILPCVPVNEVQWLEQKAVASTIQRWAIWSLSDVNTWFCVYKYVSVAISVLHSLTWLSTHKSLDDYQGSGLTIHCIMELKQLGIESYTKVHSHSHR
jgi:hypothetical protein